MSGASSHLWLGLQDNGLYVRVQVHQQNSATIRSIHIYFIFGTIIDRMSVSLIAANVLVWIECLKYIYVTVLRYIVFLLYT